MSPALVVYLYTGPAVDLDIISIFLFFFSIFNGIFGLVEQGVSVPYIRERQIFAQNVLYTIYILVLNIPILHVFV